MPKVPERLLLLARFILAGLANTAVGLSVTAVFDLGLHLHPNLANALGYAAGILVGFTLSRTFVFRSRAAVRSSGPRYGLVVAAAFILNQMVLWLAGRVLGPGPFEHLAAQGCGMATYTVSVFLACRYWVFRPAAEPA